MGNFEEYIYIYRGLTTAFSFIDEIAVGAIIAYLAFGKAGGKKSILTTEFVIL